jgi:nitrite reductase/ring-hydroxylating ferredoxin subunit
MEEGFVRVAALADVPPGGMRAVRVGGEEVVLYNVKGMLFATRDSCTHQHYPLSRGTLRGKYVRCGLHGWEYDVTTGAYQGDPRIRVRCFPVKVEEGQIYVGMRPLPPPPPPAPAPSRDEA